MIKPDSKRHIFYFIIASLFLFRLFYGLTNEFWFPDQDVIQIYLIGLKFFTTGQWSYFGPDLVYTHAQIPGALQGLLVAVPWFVWKSPEAPFVFLSLAMTSALCFLAWYLSKRLPEYPKTLLYTIVLTLPWAVCYFTRIINPSYVVVGSILFFIAIFELIPKLSIDILDRRLAFFMAGFALLWVFQLHMSYVLMLPYIAVAFYYEVKRGNRKSTLISLGFFFLGCLTTGAFLIPTLISYGLRSPGSSGTSSMILFNPANLLEFFNYLIKFLAFACWDVTRFIGGDSPQRISYYIHYTWAAPFTIFVTAAGVLQLIAMVVLFFNKRNQSLGWKSVRSFTLVTFVLLVSSSLFSRVPPYGHSSAILFPVAVIYMHHCFSGLVARKWFRRLLWMVVASSAIMYISIGIKNFRTISIYTNRVVVQKALDENNYQYLGKRRYEK